MTKIVAISFCFFACVACEERHVFAASEVDTSVRIERDEDLGKTRMEFALTEGAISWNQILAAFARRNGFNESALPGFSGRVDVSGLRGRFSLVALNLVLSPLLRFSISDDGNTLLLTVDDLALLSTTRRLKELLRERTSRSFRPRPADGLFVDEDWRKTRREKSLVVAVHGLASKGDLFDSILNTFRERGQPCAMFRYRNDQPVIESAKELSRALRKLRRQEPDCEIRILAHSMGGLVARAVVEDPKLDPGGVGRLVLVAVPNHGSRLAHFAFGLEVWEHAVLRKNRSLCERFYAAIEDGLGEAHRDLRPNSRFLRSLNSRGRNPATRYSLFLGSKSPASEKVREALERWVETGERHRFFRFVGPRLRNEIADLDEIVAGKGDGAVAIKRGRLDGVDDTVILEFDHLGVWADSAALKRAILQRL